MEQDSIMDSDTVESPKVTPALKRRALMNDSDCYQKLMNLDADHTLRTKLKVTFAEEEE